MAASHAYSARETEPHRVPGGVGGDAFDLPEGAELLASTAICQNQTFRYGKPVLAFQVHPEGERQSRRETKKWSTCKLILTTIPVE